ncbi:MAG: hypothetical protein LQ345_002861 [Seirophora villosa]|nr:MAG: hypothetical protein LQ345_002861 [Seirophora villosa]
MPSPNRNDISTERTAPTQAQSSAASPSPYSLLNHSTITNSSIVFNLCPNERGPRNPPSRPPTPAPTAREREPTLLDRIRNFFRSPRRRHRRRRSGQTSPPSPPSPPRRQPYPALSSPPTQHQHQQPSSADHARRRAFELPRPGTPSPAATQYTRPRLPPLHRNPSPPPQPPSRLYHDLSMGVDTVFRAAFSSGREVRGRAFLAREDEDVGDEEGPVSSVRDVTWVDDAWR